MLPIFVGDRCNDHSANSGYDQVCAVFPDAGWLSGRALEKGLLSWHREPRQAVELERSLFHVFYGDCSGRALPRRLRELFPDAKIVASAHRPGLRLRDDEAGLSALHQSDAVITVSSAQALELRELGVCAPIHYVPHGVWTRVFGASAPGPEPATQKVLIVGSFLRDWAGAQQVMNELSRLGFGSIALGAGSRDHLAADGRLAEVPSRASEEDLVKLYRTSAALFLPFLDATASNALLEAMSAGCAIICPSLPSLIDDYLLGDDTDCFTRGDYDAALSRLLPYVREPATRFARASSLKARAETFDWERLRPSLQAVYDSVIERDSTACAQVPATTGTISTLTLSSEEQSELARALSVCNVPQPGTSLLELSRQAVRCGAPRALLEALERLKRSASGPALWIRGIPVDADLPLTPMRSCGPRSHFSEAVALGLATQLGQPIAYRDEHDGVLVQDVFPRFEERASPSNASFDVALDLHTEVAFVRGEPFRHAFEISPDFLLLSCLRSAPNHDATTRVVGVRELLSRLGSEDRRVLTEPRFRLSAPYSFTRGGDGSRPLSDVVPLVYAEDQFCLDLACGTHPTDADSRRALDALRAIARDESVGTRVMLEAGDVLVLDNRRALHGRSAFGVRADGRDRWIQRVYVRTFDR